MSNISGKVSKVSSANSAMVSYTDPWSKATSSVVIAKTNHGLKLNDVVSMTIKNTTPRAISNVAKAVPKK
jgi:hypothetical protein